MEKINNNNSYKMIIWTLLTIFYVYQYVLRILPDVFANFFIENWNVSGDKLGQIFGIYYIGYAIMHIPFGIWADTGKIKTIVSLTIIGIIASLFMMNIAHNNWMILLFSRFLLGACSAAAWTILIKTSASNFKRFSLAISMSAFIGHMLSGYSNNPLYTYYKNNSWEEMNYLLIYMAAILLILCFLFMPNKLFKSNKVDEGGTETNNIGEENSKQKTSKLKTIIKNKEYILYCILGGLMVGIIEGFVGGWANKLFHQAYSSIITEKQISTLLPFLLAGFAFGTPLISMICEVTKKDFLVLIFAASIMLVSFSLVLSGMLNSYIQIAIAATAMGTASGYQCSIMALAIRKMPQEISGLASAIVNMIIMTAGYIFHTIIGLMMGDAKLIDLQRALSIIPIGLLLAIFLGIYLHINDKRSKASV
ncbi:MAG: MFS transporter [Anaplasmataceae bacterium]|nr:MFS transporter [Anaplasmataceae bacterium]